MLKPEKKFKVHLYKSKSELEHTIFCIGSHDLTLDLLAQFLSEQDRRFVSANVGSQGGLVALRRGEAHLAGSHLFDPQTGEFNIPYIRQYMPDIPVKVVALAIARARSDCKARKPKGDKKYKRPQPPNGPVCEPSTRRRHARLVGLSSELNGDFSRNDFKGTIKKNILISELRRQLLPAAQIADLELQPPRKRLIWILSHYFKNVTIWSFRKNLRIMNC